MPARILRGAAAGRDSGIAIPPLSQGSSPGEREWGFSIGRDEACYLCAGPLLGAELLVRYTEPLWDQALFYHAGCWDEGGLGARLPAATDGGGEGGTGPESRGRLDRGPAFQVAGIGCSSCGEPLQEGERVARVMAIAPEPPYFLHVRCAAGRGHMPPHEPSNA